MASLTLICVDATIVLQFVISMGRCSQIVLVNVTVPDGQAPCVMNAMQMRFPVKMEESRIILRVSAIVTIVSFAAMEGPCRQIIAGARVPVPGQDPRARCAVALRLHAKTAESMTKTHVSAIVQKPASMEGLRQKHVLVLVTTFGKETFVRCAPWWRMSRV